MVRERKSKDYNMRRRHIRRAFVYYRGAELKAQELAPMPLTIIYKDSCRRLGCCRVPARLGASPGETQIVSPLIMENQMEKKMENEMETGIYQKLQSWLVIMRQQGSLNRNAAAKGSEHQYTRNPRP